MNFSRISLLVIAILCFACKKEKQIVQDSSQTIVRLDSLSNAKINLNLLKLSAEAEKDLETFEDFKNLRSFIQTLSTANPHYIHKHVDSLDLLIQTFDENLSEELNLNTINSRITVMSTELGLLKLLSESKNPNPEKILEANTRMVTAYNSLIIQLNELSLAIPENIEKELLREIEEDEE
ncbi:hypothetical protein U6A24_17440 [Aquimarina gracilis]|uniref:Uncharacterized protein n=1 Tax=Aquimarina gracilis TaxID=874422 RepID=A0ABU5ZZE3_9FLAO|nr:hypothetical protein [Aquimarina gracilis]MEB3347263.1 hypothetical protein [Aquimarina gracilis]